MGMLPSIEEQMQARRSSEAQSTQHLNLSQDLFRVLAPSASLPYRPSRIVRLWRWVKASVVRSAALRKM